MSEKYKYELRGVSATKDEVHAAIKNQDKGLFPNAFCKILPDVVGNDPAYCNLMHADTAGTKTSIAYMDWKETGNDQIWRGIAQDAIVMNLDDMACVGCVDHIVLSSTIGRNKQLISGAVIQQIIESAQSFTETMSKHGVGIHLAGGETADVGDVVRSIDVGYTAFARMKREDLIVNDVQDGDVIVGVASYGQATYESVYNSGIGSNGLTSARHDVLRKSYAKDFPDSFDPNIVPAVVYTGSKSLQDVVEYDGQSYRVGDLLLSPTRTYLPVIKAALDQFRSHINGMIHNTGGGQTKVLKFVENKHIIKDNLIALPPVFKLIKEESGTDWKELYQVFNMGCRLEFYLPAAQAPALVELVKNFGIDAQIIGRVEAADTNKLTLESPFGQYTY